MRARYKDLLLYCDSGSFGILPRTIKECVCVCVCVCVCKIYNMCVYVCNTYTCTSLHLHMHGDMCLYVCTHTLDYSRISCLRQLLECIIYTVSLWVNIIHACLQTHMIFTRSFN